MLQSQPRPRRGFGDPHPADARMKDACQRMTASIHAGQKKSWRCYDISRGRALPWRGLVRLIDEAKALGAPLADVLALSSELEAYARFQYAREGHPPMSVVLLEEAYSGAAADIAQSDALADPSPSHLHRVVETGDRHLERLRDLLIHARHRLLSLHLHAKTPTRIGVRAGGVRDEAPNTIGARVATSTGGR